jgi:hypothetical protein
MGRAFTGVIEVNPASYGKGQAQRFPIELPHRHVEAGRHSDLCAQPPSNSVGRAACWIIAARCAPKPSGCGRNARWAGKPSSSGRCRARRRGLVALRTTKRNQPDIQPASARFQPAMFPDNPLVLEGLDAMYLNSEDRGGVAGQSGECLARVDECGRTSHRGDRADLRCDGRAVAAECFAV